MKESEDRLPGELKSVLEKLSGLSMDDAHLHLSSGKPDFLVRSKYAEDIRVATDHEQHLPHEKWYVVQQQKGRVNLYLT